MNVHYIRAAIEENTGQRLSLKEVTQLLLEEKLITKSQARHAVFRGYGEFYDYFYKHDKNVIEVKSKQPAPLDSYTFIEGANA